MLCGRVLRIAKQHRGVNMFQKVIDWFGSQAELARVVGVTRGAVAQWASNGIPAHRAIQIEALTDGDFKAVDIEGARLDG